MPSRKPASVTLARASGDTNAASSSSPRYPQPSAASSASSGPLGWHTNSALAPWWRARRPSASRSRVRSSPPASSNPANASGNAMPAARARDSSRFAKCRTANAIGDRPSERVTRIAGMPCACATSMVARAIPGQRWRFWCVSTCDKVRPAARRVSTCAANSQRTSSRSTRPSAHLVRNGRHPLASWPSSSTSVGTSLGASTGPWWPTSARWAPTPSPESRSAPAAARSAAPFASADVLVTMPSFPARRIARLTPSVRPKSSAFTISSGSTIAGEPSVTCPSLAAPGLGSQGSTHATR